MYDEVGAALDPFLRVDFAYGKSLSPADPGRQHWVTVVVVLAERNA